MKKIINGKKYDTETATALGEYSSGSPFDLGYQSETLYQKTNGELFLVFQGGVCAGYSLWDEYGEELEGDPAFVPVDEDRAKKWAELHCSVDVYEQVFGPTSE